MKTLIFVLFLTVGKLLTGQFENYVDTNKVSNTLFDQLKIFPNPTNDILYIRNGHLINSYHLMDLSGVIVKKGEYQTHFISLDDLAAGHYFLLVEIQGFYKRFLVIKN